MIGSRSPSRMAAGPTPARMSSARTLELELEPLPGRHDEHAPGDVRPVLRVMDVDDVAGRLVDAAPEAERLGQDEDLAVGVAGDHHLIRAPRETPGSCRGPPAPHSWPAAHARRPADLAAHGRLDALLDAGEDHLVPRLPGAYQAHLAESVITAPGRPAEDGRDVGAGVGHDLDAGASQLFRRTIGLEAASVSRPWRRRTRRLGDTRRPASSERSRSSSAIGVVRRAHAHRRRGRGSSVVDSSARPPRPGRPARSTTCGPALVRRTPRDGWLPRASRRPCGTSATAPDEAAAAPSALSWSSVAASIPSMTGMAVPTCRPTMCPSSAKNVSRRRIASGTPSISTRTVPSRPSSVCSPYSGTRPVMAAQMSMKSP